MMTGTIVSAYTRDNGYTKEAEQLRSTLDRLGLEHRIEPYNSFGSWVKNCAYKASFLMHMRTTLGGPILWLDSDARVMCDPWPLLDDLDCDIAAHLLGGVELISSTVYLADTQACRDLMGQWVALQQEQEDVWDQKVLHDAIRLVGNAVRFHELPSELCWIDAAYGSGRPDISQRHYGDRRPVIVQTQASRRLKN
jgi:hypothetical protein